MQLLELGSIYFRYWIEFLFLSLLFAPSIFLFLVKECIVHNAYVLKVLYANMGTILFQFLIVMSICTNCVLLVCLYDREGKWNISPGLAAILLMEHALLLIKFLFSHIVPEVKSTLLVHL